jgi:hypothetical protein
LVPVWWVSIAFLQLFSEALKSSYFTSGADIAECILLIVPTTLSHAMSSLLWMRVRIVGDYPLVPSSFHQFLISGEQNGGSETVVLKSLLKSESAG